jgi:hypothetical protein
MMGLADEGLTFHNIIRYECRTPVDIKPRNGIIRVVFNSKNDRFYCTNFYYDYYIVIDNKDNTTTIAPKFISC